VYGIVLEKRGREIDREKDRESKRRREKVGGRGYESQKKYISFQECFGNVAINSLTT